MIETIKYSNTGGTRRLTAGSQIIFYNSRPEQADEMASGSRLEPVFFGCELPFGRWLGGIHRGLDRSDIPMVS